MAPATASLAVTRLRLTDFRNYKSLALDLEPIPVIATGPNGAGKTNLLEAISFLSPGRGLRQARLSEIDINPTGLSKATAGWAVAATVETAHGPIKIGTGRMAEDEKRVVRISGATAKSQSVLAEYVSAVWLTPQMDRIFVDGPSGRRRFMDRLAFGFDTAHAGRVSAYESAMRQRGRLLREGMGDDVWLGVLESTMAERGVAIAAARREIADRLNRACAIGGGPFPQAQLTVDGTLEAWLETQPALDVEERMRHALAESRREEAENARASIGPHRSDLQVRHVEKDQPADRCSTGEQKALLIAIVLADARLRAAERDAAPLLLLDEVAAHLDRDRREALFDEIYGLNAQVWLTGTDVATFDGMRNRAQFLDVQDGRAHLIS
jgi:DNA replication and repair protein RecF